MIAFIASDKKWKSGIVQEDDNGADASAVLFQFRESLKCRESRVKGRNTRGGYVRPPANSSAVSYFALAALCGSFSIHFCRQWTRRYLKWSRGGASPVIIPTLRLSLEQSEISLVCHYFRFNSQHTRTNNSFTGFGASLQ